MSSLPETLGQLRKSSFSEPRLARRRVKDELRENLLDRLRQGGNIFPGIVGYEDTVTPQVVNALLSRHNFILLGLRGQAKSRILRALTSLLDAETPYLAGCEIHDNPYDPICRRCKDMIKSFGDDAPIAWLSAEERYVEKLATPDVTIADLIGDIDPIKAAKQGFTLASELTVHYGLLPRANRGIFAINELPDLAGKIQVGLFNIMQEGDVQIKGYPIRLPLDVALVFSANPEDYTARGKIITPLKDRIGSEIRTHYPSTVEEGISITQQEAWTRRDGTRIHIPSYIHEIVEQIAFVARDDKRVDKRSGVSQRLPISTVENVLSNAERRALRSGEHTVVPRVADIYAALPAITGKLELEYEGEIKGADAIAREVIRTAIAKTYDRYFQGNNNHLKQVVQYFDLGGEVQMLDTAPAEEVLESMKNIQGLMEKIENVGAKTSDAPELQASAAEFILEGLHAHKRIGRTEERKFTAGEKQSAKKEQLFREEDDFVRERNRRNRGFN
ncbi:magnesium protoporphyrin chelatase, putative [Candidatus Koribacter versatilis Ellin345]|uniref:Magnesium protoporphyrin chelatase, putative n=1 Tax=Koribacter versatilis (strain Ellin345) TaxID=204669 RepID=Q1ILJ3_KORVE|nr:magnesium protoporphyrin chelatase, putative [Candidatus Koribacter versatilis Ellin345]